MRSRRTCSPPSTKECRPNAVALFAEYKAQRRACPTICAVAVRAGAQGARNLSHSGRRDGGPGGRRRDRDARAPSRRGRRANGRSYRRSRFVADRRRANDRARRPAAASPNSARYDPPAVRERFGLDPAQLPDYRGLKGDPSDNLPGIPGVGEKTASKLLQAAGSLDALVADPELAGNPKLTEAHRAVRATGLSLPRRLDRPPRSAAARRLGG